MGRTKKPFIDKKKSVTYRLVFKSSEYGEAGGERAFIPVRGGGRGCPEMEEEPVRAPMSAAMAFSHFFGGQEPTEDDRKEIVSLGLPDDGYNYLQHVRVIGQGSCSLLQEEGRPVVDAKPVEDCVQMSSAGGIVSAAFNPPPEDRKIVYAKELTVREEIQDEDAAEDLKPATSAFSREVEGVRGRAAKEIDELEEAVINLGEEVEEGIDTVGVGDLLDDFVVLAAQADDTAATFMGDTRARENPQNIALPEDILDEDGDKDVIEIDYMSKYSRTLGSRGLGNQSLFSEKWAGTSASDLEGRRKRNDQLTLLDEKFDNMLLEYDDDELGDLEEIAEELQGETDLQDLAPEIEIFVDEVEAKGLRALVRDSETNVIVGKDDDVIRITKDLENAVLKGRRRIGREEWEDVLICVRSQSSRLDCETVLSYRSKASSYQPSRISVDRAPKKTNPPAKVTVSGQVTLSSRTGFPVEICKKSVGTCEPIEEHPSEGSEDASVNSFLERKKGETPEERKARKAAVKESQRAARARKKDLKMMYRKEHIKQQKQMAGIATKSASTVVL